MPGMNHDHVRCSSELLALQSPCAKGCPEVCTLGLLNMFFILTTETRLVRIMNCFLACSL